jgi:hypothetical protein
MKMKKSKIPQNSISFLSDLNELVTFAGKKAVIGGKLSFIDTGVDEAKMDELVPLPQRDAGKGFLANLRKSAPKLKLFAREEVFKFKRSRFAFLIDAYLSYGLKAQKKDELLAVIGGLESDTERFHIDVLIFNHNGLVRTQEHTLPPTTNHSFGVDCTDIVHSLRQEHQNIRIVVAAPMSPWNVPGTEHEESISFHKLSFKPLTAAKAAQDRYGMPAAMVVAGIAAFCALTASGYSESSAALARFENANNDPAVKKQGGVDNNYLSVTTQRRQFMDAPRRQDRLSNMTLDIIKGIGVNRTFQIVEIKMPAPSIGVPTNSVGIMPPDHTSKKGSPDQLPDVWMKISVPKSDGPALYQARDVIRALIHSTGMSIRTAPQGWAEENGRRVFMLEGFIDA